MALGWLVAQACATAGPWCGLDVPCRLVRHERDSSGIERVEIEEAVPASLPPERAATAWLVYPGFQPFLAAVGAFRHSVGGPEPLMQFAHAPLGRRAVRKTPREEPVRPRLPAAAARPGSAGCGG